MGRQEKNKPQEKCFQGRFKSTDLLTGLNKTLFIHRKRKFNTQVQETQKQNAYLSVIYRQNDNYTDIFAMAPGKRKSADN